MLKKSSLQLLSKASLALSLILLSSCISKPNNQPPEIRIVDLNGNPKPVRRMVPEGNAQMLASHRDEIGKNDMSNISNAPMQTINSPEPTNNPVFQNYQKPTSEQATNNTNDNDLAPATATSSNIDKKDSPNNKLEAAVSYDMSESAKKPEPTQAQPEIANNSNKKFKLAITKVKSADVKGAKSTSDKSGILIQIGSFSSAENANKALEQSKEISAGNIEEVDLGGKKNYRVFLGPASSKKKANLILKKAKNSGYKDAFIVK